MFSRRVSLHTVIIFTVSLFLLVGLVIIIGDRVFSYETDKTHPGIIALAVQVYNNYSKSTVLTRQETGWLQYGAVAEDTPNRWLNHFYDPIYNQGLKGLYLSAKDWATNGQEQTKYALGDKTWQRAIDDYRQGDRESAFKSLGHVLHLLADVSVPAHTRDDIHIVGDSYEQFVRSNWPALSKNLLAAIIPVSNLTVAFGELAYYSNTNFYSDDTMIGQKYKLPQLDNLQYAGGYFIQNLAGQIYKLLQARPSVLAADFYIYQLDRPVLTDYAGYLLPKAIGYTAGVIDLFFREANSGGQNYSLSPDRIGWRGYLDQLLGNAVGGLNNFYDKAGDNVANIKSDDSDYLITDSVVRAESITTTEPVIFEVGHDLSVTNSQLNSTNSTMIGSSSPDFFYPTQISSFIFSSGDSQQILAAQINSNTPETALAGDIFSLAESLDFSTATITVSSTLAQTSSASSTPIIIVSTTVTSSNQGLNNSTNTIMDNSTSTCGQATCSASTSTVDLFLLDFSDLTSQTSSAPEYNVSSTTTTTETQLSRQVVINEIAWAGTHQEQPNDEWLELFNNSFSSVDISKWRILLNGQELKIAKHNKQIIAPFGYYLLERSDDDTIKQITADAIFSGSIKNNGVKIELFNAAEEKVDQVDCSAGWFAGDDIKYRSMERIDSLQRGDDPDNWQSNQGIREDGRSYNGAPIHGSPKRANFGFIALNYRQEDDLVTLTQANNPYVLQYYEIPADKTLRIEPGVVVKSYYNNSFIDIYGRLEIVGSSTAKVVFTSGRDNSFSNALLDTVAGNWDKSEPQAGDWQGFWFHSSSSAQLTGLDMRYAGANFRTANYLPAITSQSIRAQNADLAINNSEFSHHADMVLYLDNSSTTITSSSFSKGDLAIKARDSKLVLSQLEFDGINNDTGPIQIDGHWPEFDDLKFSGGTREAIAFGQVEIKNEQIDLRADLTYIFSSLTVDSSSTLNIKPGTQIELLTYGTMTINGQMAAIGTAGQPIYIGKNMGWGYLMFNNSSSTFEHVYINGGGGLSAEQDAAIVVQDSGLSIISSKIWNSRAPGVTVKSINSVLEVVDSQMGMDNKWPDPAWAGMSYATGIKMIGGELYLNNVGFVNLNYGVFKVNYEGEPPVITLDNMSDSNYVNVYRQFAW